MRTTCDVVCDNLVAPVVFTIWWFPGSLVWVSRRAFSVLGSLEAVSPSCAAEKAKKIFALAYVARFLNI